MPSYKPKSHKMGKGTKLPKPRSRGERKAPPAEPPTGLVTLVFTDVQGSTGIWERSPDVMRLSLGIHDQVMRDTLSEAGGYEVKTEGDAFMVAFGDSLQAVRWCLTAQERLVAAPWPQELLAMSDAAAVEDSQRSIIFRGLRVRMGVHTGVPECKPDPGTGRMDYFGPMVNRAARVGGAAHGGQILVSGWVWEQISSRLATLGDPATADLGHHRLKGLDTSERLVMVTPASLSGRAFPAPKTLNPRLSNLPPQTSSFLGRKEDLDAIEKRFSGPVRLVTLTGTGGMGKTSLALRFGLTRLSSFASGGEGGVWFCDLSEATSLEGICECLARALQFPIPSGSSTDVLVNQLGATLGGRGRMLVILDNFEQVVAHAFATVGRWLVLAPMTCFLVTSREALRLRGEAVLPLQPLSAGFGNEPPDQDPAVQLFRERAEAIRPGCLSLPKDLATVREIVRVLDGIPLAIELAAARMAILGPSDLLVRLGKHLDLLTGGGPAVPERQTTLRKAIAWSWDLLDPVERIALAQCAVFHGGFDLEAAEKILELKDFPGSPPVFEVIQALCRKSLLRTGESPEMPGRLRFGMFVGVQEFAREKLGELPERDSIMHRHAVYFSKLGRLLAPAVPGGGGDLRLRRLAAEMDNLRAVHVWTSGRVPPTPELADLTLEAAISLDPLYTTRGPFPSRSESLDRAIGYAATVPADPALLAWALEARGRAHLVAGETDACEAAYERGLSLARKSGNRKAEAFIQRNLGLKRMFSGSLMDEARARFEEALSILRAIGEKPSIGPVLGDLGCYWLAKRDLDQAARLLLQARDLNKEFGNQLLEALTLINLGIIFQEQGRLEDSGEVFRQSVTLAEELGDRRLFGYSQGYLGCQEQESGRLEEAAASYRLAVRCFDEIGDRGYRGYFTAALGGCLALQGKLEASAATFARIDNQWSALVSPPFVLVGRLHRAIAAAARSILANREGRVVEAADLAREARLVLAEGRASDLDSEDVRTALRLLESAVKSLPQTPPVPETAPGS